MVRRRPFDAQDALFDHLFRKHLRNVYTLLGSDPPGALFTPISQAAPHRPLHDQPISFLRVKVDGRAPYFEWINAARYVCGNERGTMTLVAKGLMRSVWFGFDAERLLIRVDTEGARRGTRWPRFDRLRIGFVDPAETEVLIQQPAAPRPIAYLNRAGCPTVNGDTVQVATGTILELAVPFARLGRVPGDPIRFYVELFHGDASLDRARARGCSSWPPPPPISSGSCGKSDYLRQNGDWLRVFEVPVPLLAEPFPSNRPPSRRTTHHARTEERPDRRPLGDHRARAGEAAARLQPRAGRVRVDRDLPVLRGARGHDAAGDPRLPALGTRPNGPGWRVRVVPNNSRAEGRGHLTSAATASTT